MPHSAVPRQLRVHVPGVRIILFSGASLHLASSLLPSLFLTFEKWVQVIFQGTS